MFLRTDSGSEIGSQYPRELADGHTRYQEGEPRQKSLCIWKYLLHIYFSLLNRLFNPLLYFSLFLLTVFLLFFFSRGVFSYSIGFPPLLLSPVRGSDVTRDFKHLLVQSSSLLILLSISTHSISKKATRPFYSLLLQTVFMGMYLLHKNIQQPTISPEINPESVAKNQIPFYQC